MQNFFVWFLLMLAIVVFGGVAYMAWPPVRRQNILIQEMVNCIVMDRMQQLYLEEKYRYRHKIGDKLK